MITSDSIAAVQEAVADLKSELKGDKGDLAKAAREGIDVMEKGLTLCVTVAQVAEADAALAEKPKKKEEKPQ